MALGYQIGTIMKKTSIVYRDDNLTVKLDNIDGLGRQFVQVQGKVRAAVAATGKALGLDGHYIPRSYIEQVQLERLTEHFQTVTEDMQRRFAVDGEPLMSAGMLSPKAGRSPIRALPTPAAIRTQTGFTLPTGNSGPRFGPSSAPGPSLHLPPPRPSSVSSVESTLTRELSRQDLSGTAATHLNGTAATLECGGHGTFSRHGSGTLRSQTTGHPGVQPGFDVPTGAQLLAKVEGALAAVTSRVDELALQSQVYSAKMEQQLSAVVASQQTMQTQLEAIFSGPGQSKPGAPQLLDWQLLCGVASAGALMTLLAAVAVRALS